MGPRAIHFRGSSRVCCDGAAHWVRGSVRRACSCGSRIEPATSTRLAPGGRKLWLRGPRGIGDLKLCRRLRESDTSCDGHSSAADFAMADCRRAYGFAGNPGSVLALVPKEPILASNHQERRARARKSRRLRVCCSPSVFLIPRRVWATSCSFRSSSMHVEDRQRRWVLDWHSCSLAERLARRVVVGSVSASVWHGSRAGPEREYWPGVRAILHRCHRLGRPCAHRLRGNRRPFKPASWHSFIGMYGGRHSATGLELPGSFLVLRRR